MASETALGSLDYPARFRDLYLFRRARLDWRFYHGVHTNSPAPLRHLCLAVATPTPSSDASDLAAVFATLAHIREDTHDLGRAIDDAFPGARHAAPPRARRRVPRLSITGLCRPKRAGDQPACAPAQPAGSAYRGGGAHADLGSDAFRAAGGGAGTTPLIVIKRDGETWIEA
jgi:hypothetical protein